MKTKKVLLTVILLFSSISISLIGQSFEGRIVYRITHEDAIIKSNSHELSKDIYYGDTIAILYIKNDQLKLVYIDPKTQRPNSTILYDPIKRKVYYNYRLKSELDKTVFDFNEILLEKPKISQNYDDTILVLGKKCKSIHIVKDSIFSNIIYYSTDYKTDLDSIAKNIFGFPQYIFLSGSIPLKIISLGPFSMKEIYTAKEITEKKLKTRIFKTPKEIR